MDKKEKMKYVIGGAIGMIVGIVLITIANSGNGGAIVNALGMAAVAGSTAALMTGFGLVKRKK